MITCESLRELVSYDHETGVFINKALRSRKRPGSQLGCVNKAGYLVIRIGKNNLYLAHRLAWLYHYGTWPDGVIDHINMVKTDNRISNLRDVSRRINQENRICAAINNATGFLGVTYSKKKNKYVAQIRVKGKQHFLGHFDDPHKANLAYIEAKRKLHDGCAI